MQRPLSHNWQAKLVSVFIALAIWAYVKERIEPEFFDHLIRTVLPGK